MSLKAWLDIPRGSPFSLANIPFGIITHAEAETPRPAVAIGDHALDLQIFTASSGFASLSSIQPFSSVFSQPTLNAFAALGQPLHSVVRKYLQSVFSDSTPYPHILRDNAALRQKCLIPLASVRSHLPMQIGDYTDFFAGLHHAHNCGVIFRGAANALQPNYKYLPVGYHGRASSLVISGTPIRRPHGQILLNPTAEHKQPVCAPTRNLDIELELAVFVCKPSALGEPIAIDTAREHLFGCVLMNDWSARDVQGWEYVPLGPFNAKNFGTSVSPWVVLMEALEPFRTSPMSNDVAPLPYLDEAEKKSVFDIQLSVELTTAEGKSVVLSRTNAKNLLFSFPQMLAHHSITGCPFNVGDLLGSGTISGGSIDDVKGGERSLGCFLELTRGGKTKIDLGDGVQRLFLEDGDKITLRGVAGTDEDALVGFGQCEGVILPAHKSLGTAALGETKHLL